MCAPGGGAWLLPGGHAWLLWEGMRGCCQGRAWLLPGGAYVAAPGGGGACVGYDKIQRYDQ